MAKRKRLTTFGLADEPGATLPNAATGVPPVARIAADAATQSALEDLAQELRQAREGGRMVVELPLDRVDAQHLTRDRMDFDPEDMAALMASIRDRGQQTPIEVVALEGGRHGLISGARRLTAMRRIHEETGDDRFASIKALLRPAATAADTYLAMVEENEIRSDLSFYERARLAHEAARLGVFENPQAAVRSLFVHVSASKRSKILNFVMLHEALGHVLRFPEAIPEKLGLPLVKALNASPDFAGRVVAILQDAAPETAARERELLDGALRDLDRPKGKAKPATARIDHQLGQGLRLSGKVGAITLSGDRVTEELVDALREWLERQ
ncbi:ParB N-terminal domain-containing protein [Paracoccus sp. 1_MG-2023]|uniref:ParB/RepB/Spo0J family partition protein n=1 Tax=unclassified Paracoccus (in: a-proteobacteria) TaxID=2688777 RepID=UPI001C080541|nr:MULTISPECIES: ParB N-terminal domain-containing protein [unclassified Paracoccus (in: a-proteobacteria)]MBU2958924.1 ParB N-terminal domain-containing protein [Paracoccus sp. C2R09]MDO6669986.1 ParB N-terminal domain-containing protein [Paracoccus sp. 1_MG-2023]